MDYCPHCQSLVNDSPRCPRCGADLSLVQQVESLENEVRQTRTLLRDRLDQIGRTVTLLRVEALNRVAPPTATVPAPNSVEVPVTSASVDVGDAQVPQITAEPPPIPMVSFSAAQKATPESGPAPVPVTAGVESSNLWAETQFGQKWLLIAGIVIMLFGIGYFLKYSFERNWISPAVRVLMTYGVGGTLLGLGEWFRRRHENFGLCLAGGGVAACYFSTFAADRLYHLLPTPLAFGLMIVVTVLAGALALAYDAKWLAVLGLVGGFATPLLIRSDVPNETVLFTYMAILNGGLLWIASHKQWRLLNYLGFFFTWGLFSASFISRSISEIHHGSISSIFWRDLFFLNLFYLVYAIAPFAKLLRGRVVEELQGFGLTVPNSAIAFGLSYGLIKDYTHSSTWVSVATIAYAALQLGFAQVLFKRAAVCRDAMLISIGHGLFFLALTIPLLFSNQWITISWAIEAVLVLWVAQRVRSGWLAVGAAILTVLTVGRLLCVDYERYRWMLDNFAFAGAYGDHLAARLLTDVFVLGGLFLSGWLLAGKEPGVEQAESWSLTCYTGFGLLLFYLLNVEVGGFFTEAAPTAKFAALSVLWALYSVGLIVIGFVRKLEAVRYTAIGLFAATIIKVFLFDMANVATPYRIISFIVLGLMLIGASFLYYKFRDRLLEGEGK